MMNLRIIVLFATFALVNANQLTSYNIKNIVCENLEHKYDEYYRAPCKIWKEEMSKRNPKNMIQCMKSVDGDTGKILHGCKPAFGTKDDNIIVSYHFQKNDVCNESLENTCDSKYIIIAKAQLYNVVHPIVSLIIIALGLFGLVMICSTDKTYSDAYMGAAIGATMFGRSGYSSGDTWSWNYED